MKGASKGRDRAVARESCVQTEASDIRADAPVEMSSHAFSSFLAFAKTEQ